MTPLVALTEGRCGVSNLKILLQVKEQDGPQCIALAKVTVFLGPAGVTEFDEYASALALRELEASDGADGMARPCNTLPLDGLSIRSENFHSKLGPSVACMVKVSFLPFVPAVYHFASSGASVSAL